MTTFDNQQYILGKIDAYAEKLQWAQQENDNIWKTLLGMAYPVWFDTYEDEVDHMKQWYQARMSWLDEKLTY